jgi:hypothetical protein
MNKSAELLSLNRCHLAAVPAIHFRAAFAQHVHRICYSSEFVPDALAVELEPEALAATMKLLNSFAGNGISPSKLPCMLGLTRTGQQLNPFLNDDGSIDTLYRTPSKSKTNTHRPLKNSIEVLPVSPTDSIIEAIRCGLEMKLPIYGIDLELAYPSLQDPSWIQNPWDAEEDLAQYVRANASFAAGVHDKSVDPLREQIMAGRLKTILQRHRNVLFTGGIGHWIRLKKMINESKILPIPVKPTTIGDPSGFEPTVVHPLLAANFMDLFPAVVTAYETNRSSSLATSVTEEIHERSIRPPNHPSGINPLSLFHKIIQQSYKAYFQINANQTQLDRYSEDLAASKSYEQFLTHLCIIKQRSVPELRTILHAAKATMSPDFCKQLADVLMEFDWAAPRDFKHLNVLAPLATESGKPLQCALIDSSGHHSVHYTMRVKGYGHLVSPKIPIPWNWKAEKDLWPKKRALSIYRAWPPNDYLLSALSTRAAELIQESHKNAKTIPFEGSLHYGIDIKATIKSHIRGENKVYVHDRFSAGQKAKANADGFDPTVYIFRPGNSSTSKWFMHSGSMYTYHRDHMHNPQYMDRIAKENGNYAVGGLSYVEQTDLPETYLNAGIFGHVIRGMLVYIPPCFNGRQEARFMEDSHFKRNPIAFGSGFLDLMKLFRERHQLDLDPRDWANTLIRMAIPYASQCVTVIAPDGFMVSSLGSSEAAQKDVRINMVPLSVLPKALLRKVSVHLFCNPLDKEGIRYPEYVQRLLGEKDDANRNLIPRYLQEYGMEGFDGYVVY